MDTIKILIVVLVEKNFVKISFIPLLNKLLFLMGNTIKLNEPGS
jgi:hypothetical protein